MYPVRGIAVQDIYNMMSRPTPECIVPGAGEDYCTRTSRTAYRYRMVLLPACLKSLCRFIVFITSSIKHPNFSSCSNEFSSGLRRRPEIMTTRLRLLIVEKLQKKPTISLKMNVNVFFCLSFVCSVGKPNAELTKPAPHHQALSLSLSALRIIN